MNTSDHDKVLLISPGFKVQPEELEKTKDFWRKRGFDLLHKPHLLSLKTNDLLCSETLAVRLQELKEAFASNESDFVWSLRGGYGAHQLLPFLDPADFKKQKIFLGFSDGTSIHYYLNMHLDWPSLHCPHPNTFHKGIHEPIIEEKLKKVLIKKNETYEFKGLEKLNNLGEGFIEGEVVGGNLTTLVSLLGTPFNKGAKNKILFLEEVEEPAYKVSRHLNHMQQAGFFEGVQAIVFGHMTHSKTEQEHLVKNYIQNWSKELGIQVLWGLNAGHFHKFNNPIWFGKKTRIHLDENLRIINNI